MTNYSYLIKKHNNLKNKKKISSKKNVFDNVVRLQKNSYNKILLSILCNNKRVKSVIF